MLKTLTNVGGLSKVQKARRFQCLLTGHVRSRGRSYVDPLDKRRRSYCRRCDAPMQKTWPAGWQPRAIHSHFSCVISRLGEAETTHA